MIDDATGFRKASHSNHNGACVEVGSSPYRKSSHSATGNCVEVGSPRGHAIIVRDTMQHDDPARTALSFTPSAWAQFMTEVTPRSPR